MNTVTIVKSVAGYTSIRYNNQEIAKHYLSATTDGTREAFDIPEELSVLSWIIQNFSAEIEAIAN